jgi:hypothetical protein
MDKYKPLIGNKKDCGILQIFYQSVDAVKNYPTALNGEYNLKLVDLKVIVAGAGALNSEYFIQLLSSTLRTDKSNLNDNFKFMHRNGTAEITSPLMFNDVNIKNWVDLDFVSLGVVGAVLNAHAHNILLTFEYEKL